MGRYLAAASISMFLAAAGLQARAAEDVVIKIHTDNNTQGWLFWAILDGANQTVANGGPYINQANTLITENRSLPTTNGNCFSFVIMKTNGSGLCCNHGNGYWEIRTPANGLLLRDLFDNSVDGSNSPSSNPMSPGYGNGHSFCLPAGTVNIAPTECGIFDNLMGNKVYAVKQAGKNYLNQTLNYQFEFSDPDAGFIRRIARPQNYVIFWDMVTNPLTPGVKYFARVRTDKNGPMANAHWGTGCEMGIGLAVLGCTGLIQTPAYGHSCNETRSFSNSSYIYTNPVQAATEYEFRIFNLGEGYDQTFVRNTYILQLKWTEAQAPLLQNGYTYQVQARAKVAGVWSAYCGSTCSITINNTNEQLQHRAMPLPGTATLWPNPVADGRVNLNVEGLDGQEQLIKVEVLDLAGRNVLTGEYGNSGPMFNTILSMPDQAGSGLYTVLITVSVAGQQQTRITQRLSMVR